MAADAGKAKQQIERNVAIHDRVARKYDRIHGEIFNEHEQTRLRATLVQARASVLSRREPIEALDFGCGSGNLTRHLLDLGVAVTAADVSQGFLDLVANRYPAARTLLMKGGSTNGVADESYDLIATYSVLHHIPDYLGAVAELGRMCRTGGVVLIDHEQNEAYWRGDPVYREFRRRALRFDWAKFLTPANYVHRLRRIFNSRHSNEGDIHVWPDDHIEWPKIKELMARLGFEVVLEHDYLLNRKLYRGDVYQRYAGRCTDTKAMIFRKHAS